VQQAQADALGIAYDEFRDAGRADHIGPAASGVPLARGPGRRVGSTTDRRTDHGPRGPDRADLSSRMAMCRQRATLRSPARDAGSPMNCKIGPPTLPCRRQPP